MRAIIGALGLGLLTAALLVPRTVPAAEAAKEEIKVVTYAQLGDIIKQNRGKVVVVDFWNAS